MEILKLINPIEFISQLICFFLILALLRMLVWNKILTFLDQRNKRIEDQLNEIETMRKDVEVLKNDYNGKIKNIETQAQARIVLAVSEGEKISRGIKDQAQIDAAKTIENAQEYIRQEMFKAKDELKRSLVELTINATEKVIQRAVDSDQDRRLVKEMVDQIERQL